MIKMVNMFFVRVMMSTLVIILTSVRLKKLLYGRTIRMMTNVAFIQSSIMMKTMIARMMLMRHRLLYIHDDDR